MSEPTTVHVGTTAPVSDRGFVTALLLCLFLGWLGAHRFYAGKVGTGVVMLITLWIFTLALPIWRLIDLNLIATGSFRDGDGLLIKPPRS